MLDLNKLRAAETGWQITAFQKQSIVAFCTQGRPSLRPVWWLPYLIKPLIGVGVAAATAFAMLLVWPLIRQEPGQTEITAGAPGSSQEARPDEYIENPEQPSGSQEPNTPRQDPEENPIVTPPADTDQPEDTPSEEPGDEDASTDIDYFEGAIKIAYKDNTLRKERSYFEELFDGLINITRFDPRTEGDYIQWKSADDEYLENALNKLEELSFLDIIYVFYDVYHLQNLTDPLPEKTDEEIIKLGDLNYFVDGQITGCEVSLKTGEDVVFTLEDFRELPLESLFVAINYHTEESDMMKISYSFCLTTRGEEEMSRALEVLEEQYNLVAKGLALATTH